MCVHTTTYFQIGTYPWFLHTFYVTSIFSNKMRTPPYVGIACEVKHKSEHTCNWKTIEYRIWLLNLLYTKKNFENREHSTNNEDMNVSH